uniref:Uncharacterized protein n=1 Tax=Triticum urartu TaxID=4572 RepID=A0A8R7R0D6_TRIUA
MAISAKERKLSRLGSGKAVNGGGGGSFGARGGHRSPAAGGRRRLFAVFFVFLCAGAVVFGGVHAIGASFRPVLLKAWPSATLNALSSERRVQQAGGNGAGTVSASVQIRHAVALPDHLLVILGDGSLLPAPGQFECLYSTANSTQLCRRPLSVAALPDGPSLVHCPAGPSEMAVSLSLSQSPPVTPFQWDQLVYTALLDSRDNSTVVFAKGMNLRPGRLGVPSRKHSGV